MSNLPVGTQKEVLLKAMAEISVIPIGCAFTQTADNRSVAELWF